MFVYFITAYCPSIFGDQTIQSGMLGCFEDKEDAENYAKKLREENPKYKFKIKEMLLTKKIQEQQKDNKTLSKDCKN